MSFATLRTGAARAAAALLIAGAWACESAELAAPDQVLFDERRPAPTSEVDVQEATFRWLFENKGATGFDAYCISTGWPESNDDPSAELLARFAGNQPPVVPLSDCTISVAGDTYNPTGGPAQWFFVGPATITGRTATLDAGFHINGRLAEFFDCTLRLTGQGWVVRECVLTGAA
ncbi:MAG TPA: hypothetical protein VFX98_19050 [Longimicrobiaceae bacterium]|nr:hypothetical protein [Longimicrobiaceae bacterium]